MSLEVSQPCGPPWPVQGQVSLYIYHIIVYVLLLFAKFSSSTKPQRKKAVYCNICWGRISLHKTGYLMRRKLCLSPNLYIHYEASMKPNSDHIVHTVAHLFKLHMHLISFIWSVLVVCYRRILILQKKCRIWRWTWRIPRIWRVSLLDSLRMPAAGLRMMKE